MNSKVPFEFKNAFQPLSTIILLQYFDASWLIKSWHMRYASPYHDLFGNFQSYTSHTAPTMQSWMWSMTPEIDLRSAAIQRMWEGGVVMNLVVNHLWLIPSACIDMWCKQCDGPVLRLDKFNASGQKEVIEAVSKPHNTQVWCLNCNDCVFSREKYSLRHGTSVHDSAALPQYYTCVMILYCDVTVTDCQVTNQNLTVAPAYAHSFIGLRLSALEITLHI